MTKLRLLLATIAIAPAIAIAQPKISPDFEISSGAPYKVIDAGVKDYISLDNGFAIMLKMDGDKMVSIQKYDVENMKEVARNEYEDLPKYAHFLETIKLQDKLFLIYDAYDKSDKENKHFAVYAREIMTDDATFGSPVELFQTSRPAKATQRPADLAVSGKYGTTMTFISGGPKFVMTRSFDESKIMIHYILKPEERDNSINKDVFGFIVLDNSMTKVWAEEVQMPYTEDEMRLMSVAVSKDGEAKLLIVNTGSKSYEMISVASGGDITTTNTGQSSEKAVQEFRMTEDEEGHFNCGGIYSYGMDFKTANFLDFPFMADGVLFMELDKTGELVKAKSHEFPAEFIKQNLTSFQKKRVEKREEKGKAGIFDLNLKDMVIKEDGSVYFLAERQNIEQTSTSSSTIGAVTGAGNSYVYYFSNIIVVKMNPDGELAWMKKMPKNQKGTSGLGQMSFSHMEGTGSDYIAYVDNPKNIALSPDGGVPKVHMDGKGGFLTTYKFNHETGALDKHTLLDLKKVPGGHIAYQFKASRVFKVGPGTFLMEIYIKGKEDTMVKFKLK